MSTTENNELLGTGTEETTTEQTTTEQTEGTTGGSTEGTGGDTSTEEIKKAINLKDLKYVKKYINDRFTEMNTIINNKYNAVFNEVYPVGSIYMSVNNTNPQTLFGGTWVAWGSGKVPVGVDVNDTDFATVESTGGEKVHTLTIEEMPEHNHKLTQYYSNGNNFLYSTDPTSNKSYSENDDASSTKSTGGGVAHNNLQPYITCYMWKRTA